MHNPMLKAGIFSMPEMMDINGISLNKTYEFLKGRKSRQVIVAVIDTGVDTTQEDLKNVLWKNPKEIAGNGIDDDNNGYTDDVLRLELFRRKRWPQPEDR